ncbi:hypothetical protein Dsin_018999 [Dipteronia sinensis]|uniref:Uncharacterized protein n=1 Tax=Dipteronia sinensis TaxID=43782 RepID=A0AAE0A7U6_9ROSI|nr:hypothetical protein Dsin_018999 [Dipteronia sinensis]
MLSMRISRLFAPLSLLIGHLPNSCLWNKSSKVPLTSSAKSTQEKVGDSTLFGDNGFQPVRTRSSKSIYRHVIAPREKVSLSNVFLAIHKDLGGQDSVVVHTSVESNLISGSTSPTVLVSNSSVVDPSISLASSAVGVVHDSRTVVQGSSVVNQVRLIVSTILSRSSSCPGHMAHRKVKVQEVSGNQSSEEAVVSSIPNFNKDLIFLVLLLSEYQAELRLIVDSLWAFEVEEGELADTDVAQRAMRVERRLASLKVLQAFRFSSVFMDWIDGIHRSSRLSILLNEVLEGVHLFRGKPRKVMLRPIANKILSKFAKWKGKSLSLAGHATLIRSVITGSFVHSFMIYKWPSSLLSLIHSKLRNFLWTGSCEETKLVRVAWDRCCRPYSQGGLGLKDLGLLNDSLLRKFTWKFLTSDILLSHFFKRGILGSCRSLKEGLILGMVVFLARLLIPSFSVIFLRLSTDDHLCKFGFQLASRCSIWVWTARYQWIFEENSVDFRSILSPIWRAISEANRLDIGCMRHCMDTWFSSLRPSFWLPRWPLILLGSMGGIEYGLSAILLTWFSFYLLVLRWFLRGFVKCGSVASCRWIFRFPIFSRRGIMLQMRFLNIL